MKEGLILSSKHSSDLMSETIETYSSKSIDNRFENDGDCARVAVSGHYLFIRRDF
jgi:hypothetical protein